jgi:hypothetical protein
MNGRAAPQIHFAPAHSRESGNPCFRLPGALQTEIPAFAAVTWWKIDAAEPVSSNGTGR